MNIDIDMNTYSYKRQEFQNILETNLCNCFGQVLLIYLKNVEHGIEQILDSPYGVCIHYTFLKFMVDSLNTLQYNQDDKFDSLLVGNIMFRGSQQILLNRFCALVLSNPLLPQLTLYLTEYQAG